MSYIDILNHIGITTLKERRDFICWSYFINMQKESHKLRYFLPDERNVQYNHTDLNKILLLLLLNGIEWYIQWYFNDIPLTDLYK